MSPALRELIRILARAAMRPKLPPPPPPRQAVRPMRCVIYARYSTERQTEASIADQVHVCREYAAAHAWIVVAEHADQGISGDAIGNRPGVQAAITRSESSVPPSTRKATDTAGEFNDDIAF